MRMRKFFLWALAGFFLSHISIASQNASPLRLQVSFGGYDGEIQVAPGEPVRLRDHRTGEVVFLRVNPIPGKTAKASIEVSRGQDFQDATAAQRTDLLELAVGEKATIRNFSSRLDVQLTSAPFEQGSPLEDDEESFQINLELPGGRSLIATGYASPDEIVRLTDHRTGIALGFRPALPKSGHQPINVEVFAFDAKGADGDGERFLARIPMGGDFTLRGRQLGLSADLEIPVKVRGHLQAPEPGLWDGMARVGSSEGPVTLKARWAGGAWIEGKAFGGLMFRLTVPGLADEIGLAPAAACSGTARNVSVFQIHKVPGAGETLKLIDTVQVRDDLPIRVTGFQGQLEIQGNSKPALQLKGMCWLGCGPETAHGCGVSCGDVDCCIGMCCRV